MTSRGLEQMKGQDTCIRSDSLFAEDGDMWYNEKALLWTKGRAFGNAWISDFRHCMTLSWTRKQEWHQWFSEQSLEKRGSDSRGGVKGHGAMQNDSVN